MKNNIRMKRFVTLAIMLTWSSLLMAQGKVVTKYFDQFENDEKFVKVSISSKMFSMFTDLESGSEAEEEFLKAISKLKGLKMVVGDSVPDAAGKLYSQAVNDVKKAGFEELMSVKDAEENLYFSVMDEGGKITELMMVAGGREKFVVLSLFGEIDLKSIARMAREMQVDGLQPLEKLDEN